MKFTRYEQDKHGHLFPALSWGGWPANFNIITRRARIVPEGDSTTVFDYLVRHNHYPVVKALRDYLEQRVKEHAAGFDEVLLLGGGGFELADIDGAVIRRSDDGSDAWEIMMRAWFAIPGDDRPPLRDPDEAEAVPLWTP